MKRSRNQQDDSDSDNSNGIKTRKVQYPSNGVREKWIEQKHINQLSRIHEYLKRLKAPISFSISSKESREVMSNSLQFWTRLLGPAVALLTWFGFSTNAAILRSYWPDTIFTMIVSYVPVTQSELTKMVEIREKQHNIIQSESNWTTCFLCGVFNFSMYTPKCKYGQGDIYCTYHKTYICIVCSDYIHNQLEVEKFSYRSTGLPRLESSNGYPLTSCVCPLGLFSNDSSWISESQTVEATIKTNDCKSDDEDDDYENIDGIMDPEIWWLFGWNQKTMANYLGIPALKQGDYYSLNVWRKFLTKQFLDPHDEVLADCSYCKKKEIL